MWKLAVLTVATVVSSASVGQAAPHGTLALEGFDSPAQSVQVAPTPPQEDHSQHHPPSSSAEASTRPGAGQHQDHQGMMAGMAADLEKLNALVKRMEAATGQEKVDVMGQVVSELVRQRKAMHDHMQMMHEHMGMMGGCGGMKQPAQK